MEKISIITQRDISIINGSTVRPKWQIKALKKIDFENVEIVTVSKFRAYRKLQNVEIVSVLKLYFVEIVLFFLEGGLRATIKIALHNIFIPI